MQTNLDLYFKKNFEIGKWDINLNTNSIIWDNKTKEIFEVSDSFIPCIKNLIAFFNRKNLILFKTLINRSMEFDTALSDKFQIITATNKIKHLECICQVDYQSDKINRIYGSIKDITHEEERIIKLESVLQKYASVCSSLQKAIVIIETKTGKIIDCNNQIYDLTAFSNEELINANYSFLFPVLNQREINLNIPFNKETILKRKDNKLVPIQISSGKSFILNDQNFLVCFIKKIDSVETSDILSLIVSKTTDLIIVTNTEGETIWANQSYLKLTETNLEQIIGKKINSICNYSEKNNEKIKEIDRAIQNKEEIENIFQITNKQNEKFWIKLNLKPIFDQNGICSKFIAIGRDITTTKNKEIEFENILEVTNQQNNKLLNFAHIVSHNIRSHTSNLQMVLDVIENSNNTTEKLSFIEMFKEGTEKLSETIENLNEVLTIQKNSNTKKTSVNLKTEIERNISNFKNKITITHNITEGIFLNVIPSYLENILQNIISNAVKYKSLDRYPKLEISYYREKNFHLLSFKDNGLGINIEKNKHKLFGMYKSFHGNDDAKGIGLFIVKNQIEAMKGKIEIESKEGEGSIFKLYFDEK